MITELAYLIFIAAGALAAGNAARQPFHKSESRLEEFLVSSGLGFIILAAVVFILGILKLYTKPAFYTIDLLLLLLIALQAKKLVAIAKPDLKWLKNSDLLTKLIFAAFAGFALLNLVVSSAPPTSSDALLYHLAVPKIYLEEHQITYIPGLQIVSEVPMSIDLLYLYGLQLLNGKLSQVLGAYLSILAALAVFLLARHFTSSNSSAIIAAALFQSLPIYSVFNARAFVDIPIAFFALMALYFFFRWEQQKDYKNAIITGLFLGMALSGKQLSLIVAAAMAAMMALLFLKAPAGTRKKFFMQASIIMLISQAFLLPWLLKTYINTGNPFQPFLYKYFGGRFWNEELGRIITQEVVRTKGVGFSLLSIPKFLFEISVRPQLFADSVGITPLFLGFMPLLLLKRLQRKIGILLVFTIILLLAHFFTAQYTRYMFLVWGLLSVLIAYIVSSFINEKLAKTGICLFILFSIAINSVIWAGANADDLSVIVGITPEHDYLKEKVQTFEATRYLGQTDPDAVVCWYGDGWGYWSTNQYIWCHPLWQAYVDFFTIKNPEELSGRLTELNVTYILFEKKMRDPVTYGKQLKYSDKVNEFHMRSNELLFAYLENNTKEVYDDANVQLFKINRQITARPQTP